MQSTIRPIAIAQTTYAMGAAGPSAVATAAGRRKMPPPMVMLAMAAARPHVPTTRTSEDSAVPGATGPEVARGSVTDGEVGMDGREPRKLLPCHAFRGSGR